GAAPRSRADPPETAPVDVHRIHLVRRIAVPRGLEDELLAVGGEIRLRVRARAGGELPDMTQVALSLAAEARLGTPARRPEHTGGEKEVRCSRQHPLCTRRHHSTLPCFSVPSVAKPSSAIFTMARGR